MKESYDNNILLITNEAHWPNQGTERLLHPSNPAFSCKLDTVHQEPCICSGGRCVSIYKKKPAKKIISRSLGLTESGNKCNRFSLVFLKWFFGSIPLTALYRTLGCEGEESAYVIIENWTRTFVGSFWCTRFARISLSPPGYLKLNWTPLLSKNDTYVPSVVPIQLLVPLSPSEDNFLGVDDHDVIAHVDCTNAKTSPMAHCSTL